MITIKPVTQADVDRLITTLRAHGATVTEAPNAANQPSGVYEITSSSIVAEATVEADTLLVNIKEKHGIAKFASEGHIESMLRAQLFP